MERLMTFLSAFNEIDPLPERFRKATHESLPSDGTTKSSKTPLWHVPPSALQLLTYHPISAMEATWQT